MDQQYALREAVGQAAKAWRDLKVADAVIDRLRSYPSMSRSMKADFAKAQQSALDARRTLDNLLKVAA